MSLIPSDIVRHLKTYLPRFTDKFTEKLNITSAAIGAGNILSITAAAHGKSAGQYVVIGAGTVRNPIIDSIQTYPIAIFTTEYDHDLTKPSLLNDDYYLTIGGFGGVWDGQHQIIEIKNRYNFQINMPSSSIVLSGTEYLSESIPIGAYQIATTPTLNTFTIDLSSSRALPVGIVDNISIVSNYRIAAAADINRARDVYSKQDTGKAYLFVIMTDTDVSKDRNFLNDSIAELTRKDMLLLRLLQSFSVSVFIPTVNDISGAAAQNLAYDEIFKALLFSLYGYSINGGMYKSVCIPAGMGPGEYNSSFYTHVYDWQLPFIINFEDAIPHESDRAFRNLDYNHLIGGDNTIDVTISTIDLDEEPIIPT